MKSEQNAFDFSLHVERHASYIQQIQQFVDVCIAANFFNLSRAKNVTVPIYVAENLQALSFTRSCLNTNLEPELYSVDGYIVRFSGEEWLERSERYMLIDFSVERPVDLTDFI